MKLAVLFSGGKDSALAISYAEKEVECLISIQSENPESYMYHTPNISLVEKQAKAMNKPIIIQKTKGEKEKELTDLKKAIKKAISKYKIQGVITGALASAYQASRVQKICNELKIECFNPLWQKSQQELMEELIKKNYEVIITGVFAEGMDPLLGKTINKETLKQLKKLEEKYKINVAGEGGEYESTIIWAPYFKTKVKINKTTIKENVMQIK